MWAIKVAASGAHTAEIPHASKTASWSLRRRENSIDEETALGAQAGRGAASHMIDRHHTETQSNCERRQSCEDSEKGNTRVAQVKKGGGCSAGFGVAVSDLVIWLLHRAPPLYGLDRFGLFRHRVEACASETCLEAEGRKRFALGRRRTLHR